MYHVLKQRSLLRVGVGGGKIHRQTDRHEGSERDKKRPKLRERLGLLPVSVLLLSFRGKGGGLLKICIIVAISIYHY